MSDNQKCPNCQTELKSGLLSSVKMLADNKIAIINEYQSPKAVGYCSKCGVDLYNECKSKLANERVQLSQYLTSNINAIPVISAHTPLNWDYVVLDMVTGQSTTGTGVISEFTSSFTDLFGAQSGRHNKKLKAGEDMCFAQLKKQTLDAGGNAVIATDIDYSELGDGKGMIMVCMAGTAIKLKNSDILGEKKAKVIDELTVKNNRLQELSKYDIPDF